MHYALIDMGSNTVRLSIYRTTSDDAHDFIGVWSRKVMASLISYIDADNVMSEAGIEKMIDILLYFKKRIKDFDEVQKTSVFATEVLRRCINKEYILDRIKKMTGFKIDVISGETEAELGFVGARLTCNINEGVQIDVGGSSSEVVCFKNKKPQFESSLPLGSLSVFLENIHGILPTPKEADDIRELVSSYLKKTNALHACTTPNLIVVGGTGRCIAKLRDAWYPKNKRAKTNEVSAKEIHSILDYVFYDPHDAMKSILQVKPDRIHTSIAGMLIIDEIRAHAAAKTLTVSKYGVREGYLLQKLLNAKL